MLPGRQPAILVTCGGGGHAEQMRRLLAHIDSGHRLPYLALVEESVELGAAESRIVRKDLLSALRSKHREGTRARSVLAGLRRAIRAFAITLSACRYHDVRLVVSTGPGLSVPVALAGRFLRCRVIHLESWSRLSTRSMTGRAMYKLATDFWVQHDQALALYPKARYVGRL